MEGKECTVGRFITPKEGEEILRIADTWVGTPYSLVGKDSIKGKRGDCSGTTYQIYVEAGFPYTYQMTATFIDYARTTNRFREVEYPKHALQAGDVLWWSGHVAIYAPFPEGHPRRDTGVIKGGVRKINNMYTAFNQKTNTPYGPYNIETFRPDKFRVFRYYLKPGEGKC